MTEATFSPLAIRQGNLDVVQVMLNFAAGRNDNKHRVILKILDSDHGWTPLEWDMYEQNLQMSLLLLKHGAHVHGGNRKTTPLHAVVNARNREKKIRQLKRRIKPLTLLGK